MRVLLSTVGRWACTHEQWTEPVRTWWHMDTTERSALGPARPNVTLPSTLAVLLFPLLSRMYEMFFGGEVAPVGYVALVFEDCASMSKVNQSSKSSWEGGTIDGVEKKLGRAMPSV